ncbi:MAG: hypothetical protein ACI9WU_002199 [Myxococcota bacterium]|jgi:hypothetical protein
MTGCAGDSFVQLAGQDYDFPPKSVLQGAVAARVTGEAVDRLTGAIGDLLPGLVGTNEAGWACLPDLDALLGAGGISVPLSLGPFSADVGARNLSLCLDLSALDVEFVQGSSPAQIRLSVDHARVAFAEPAIFSGEVDYLFGTSDAACIVDNQLGLNDVPYALDVSFVVLATVIVDDDVAFSLQSETESLTIHDIGVDVREDCSLTECSDENPGGIGDPCVECNICSPANFGADLIEFLNELLGSAFDPLIALALDAVSGPLLDSLFNGRPLDIAAAISLGNTLGALTESARTAADLGVLMRPAPGGFVVDDVASGSALSIRLQGGTAPSALHPCAIDAGAGPDLAPTPFPELADPASGQPWDAVVAVSEALLNQAVWSLYQAGGLCLGVTSRELADLSGGALSVNAGLIDVLVPGAAALGGRTGSVRLTLRPTLTAADFPVVQIAPSGSEAPLRLQLNQVEIGVEVFADNAYMRLMTLEAAVAADLAFSQGPEGFTLVVEGISVASAEVSRPGLLAPARPEDIVALGVEALVLILQSGPLTLPFDPADLQDLLGALPLTVGLVTVGPLGSDWIAAWFTLDPVVSP